MNWEYCTVLATWPGGFRNVRYSVEITYFAKDGQHRVEKLQTDIRGGSHPQKAMLALGQGLAYLGQEGWEVVSAEIGTGHTAILKRSL